MKFYFFVFFIFITLIVQAQNTISGSVFNTKNIPLQYVNIGIKQKNVGTVSNKNGFFKIEIPQSYINDSLTFSYSGLKEISISVKNILASNETKFILTPNIEMLETVVISNKKSVTKKIGIKSYSSFLFSEAVDAKSADIIEFAQHIEITKPSRILNTSLMIRDGSGDSATIRINFYSIKNDLPFEKIVPLNILKKVSTKKGWQNIDFKEYNIHIDQPFFISYEFLPTEKSLLFTYGSRLGGNIYTRKNSLGTWSKTKGGSLSAYITVKQ